MVPDEAALARAARLESLVRRVSLHRAVTAVQAEVVAQVDLAEVAVEVLLAHAVGRRLVEASAVQAHLAWPDFLGVRLHLALRLFDLLRRHLAQLRVQIDDEVATHDDVGRVGWHFLNLLRRFLLGVLREPSQLMFAALDVVNGIGIDGKAPRSSVEVFVFSSEISAAGVQRVDGVAAGLTNIGDVESSLLVVHRDGRRLVVILTAEGNRRGTLFVHRHDVDAWILVGDDREVQIALAAVDLESRHFPADVQERLVAPLQVFASVEDQFNDFLVPRVAPVKRIVVEVVHKIFDAFVVAARHQRLGDERRVVADFE